MRTSAPRAWASCRLSWLPGTRSMSPNVAKMTSGASASAMARSRSALEVTHTGQPGPETNSTIGATRERSP